MKVLILEDEPEVGRLLHSWLAEWQVDAVVAHDGEEACQLLKKSSVDMLITDLAMPNMSGFDVVRRLRQSERHLQLPVLMISGRATDADIHEAARLGINGFIAKPFKPSEIKRKILEIHRNQRKCISQQRIKQIWGGRISVFEEVSGPLIIFGEAVRSEEDLRLPANRDLVTYLSQANEAISNTNAEEKDLDLGYIIEDDTTNMIVHLRKHYTKNWVKLILLSTQCRGNPTLIVRLFTINRKDELPMFLVYSRPDDVSATHREGLRKLGVRMIHRQKFDRERMQKLITRYVLGRLEQSGEAHREKALTPEEVHGRITKDVETMSSLPPLPQVYEKISVLSKDPQSDIKDWIKAVKLDPMTCATILRHANSLSYGFQSVVTEIDRAVILMGKETVAGLVASEAVRQSFADIEEKGFILEDFWLHNMAVGFAAYILSFPLEGKGAKQAGQFAALGLSEETVDLLKKTNLPERLELDSGKENPFVGGVMHDIGKAVMVHSYPGLFPLVVAELKKSDWRSPMLAAEQEVAGGLTHTVVGEILMKNWDMSEELRRVALHHHAPDSKDTFVLLIGWADVIGQILYPMPRDAAFPLADALDEENLGSASSFLPQGFFEQTILSTEEFTALAKALSPRVKYLTEKMRHSLQ